MAGNRVAPGFHTPEDAETFDFFDIKGVIETLVERMGFALTDLDFRVDPDTGAFGPRCATMWLNGLSLGIVGEVHPRVRDAFAIPSGMRVCAAELHIKPLIRPHFNLSVMRPISVYPAVVEDLAFEVDEEVTVRRITEIMRGTGGQLLGEVELFDIYRGANLATNRKSVAFHLTYQRNDRSLSEREVASLRQRIIAAVEKETGGVLRA